MSLEANKAVVRQLYEVVNGRQWDVLDRLFAPGYVHHSSPGHDMTLGELRQVMVATAGQTGAFPDLHARLDEIIAEGEKVMVRWTQSATHTSEFMGIPPTGKRVTWSGINIFRVVDGRIAEDTPYWDFSVILRQLQESQ